MVHTYKISGMTCSGCEETVRKSLMKLDGITQVDFSRADETVSVTMEQHYPLSALQQSLSSKYRLSLNMPSDATTQTPKSWTATYKPILLISAYLVVATLLIQFTNTAFNGMEWMRHFMAGFFLVFSFFKFLNLTAFSDSYAMYDVVAKRFKAWGYVYAFVELGLGIAYLIDYNQLITNLVTFVVMSVSIIGVLQTVLAKKKIQCACLGTVFNLPMSTITIIEDGLMILMSGFMLYMYV